MPRVSTIFYFLLFTGLLWGNITVYREIFAPPVLKVIVLDVGKGGAILLRSPHGKTFLIDTGPDASILRELGAALPMWQRRIDAVLLTSSSAGSARGLPDVTGRYRVGSVIRSTFRGDRLALDDGVYADILWPPKTTTPMSPAESTIALRISYGATSFLIQNNLPPRINKWLATADATLPRPSLAISSSTPKGSYVSDGKTVTKSD